MIFYLDQDKGFCEHFASSFAMLMRYVGVPSRIVVGYQGGQLAPDGKSWEVRQLDAHAWTEVYVNQHWRRIDPTAMIAPQRIDGGMQDYMEQDRTIFGSQQSTWAYQQFSMLKKVRVWSDYASYQWQSKVVGYNAESQQQWFKKLGYKFCLCRCFNSYIEYWWHCSIIFYMDFVDKRKSLSPLEREIAKFAKNLPLSQQKVASESFRHWLQRLAENVPEHGKAAFEQSIKLFEQEIYVGTPLSSQDIQCFKTLLKTCTQSLKKSEKGLS
jgi:Transglutaminase-like enzymes, putative cysteine proteases